MARRNWWWLVVGLLAGCQTVPVPGRYPEPPVTGAVLPAAFDAGGDCRH